MGGGIKVEKLVLLAFALSFTMNLSETLRYFDPDLAFFKTPRPTSMGTIIFRQISFFLICFATLYLNIFTKDKWLRNSNAKYVPYYSVAINIVLYLGTFVPFVYFHERFFVKFHDGELNGTGFVWLVLMLICGLSASLIKLRAGIQKKLLGQQQFVRFSKESQSFKHDLQVLDKSYLTHFLLPRKKVLEPVKVKDFALFFIDDGIVKGKTFDSTIYFIDRSIQELKEKLNPEIFFRTNRQYLVNRNAVKHLEPDSYGKLGLALKVDHPEDITVSKLKSKQFKDWIVEFSA